MSNEDLLAAGRSFSNSGAPDETLLEGYGSPAGWQTLVLDACDAFEEAMNNQNSAVGTRVAANADIKAKLAELTQLKGSLRHLVKNYTTQTPAPPPPGTPPPTSKNPPPNPNPQPREPREC